MSSDSEYSESSTLSEQDSSVDSSSEADENYQVFNGQYVPYQDEPLAEYSHEDDENHEANNVDMEEGDLDGLTPSILEARYERTVEVESW